MESDDQLNVTTRANQCQTLVSLIIYLMLFPYHELFVKSGIANGYACGNNEFYILVFSTKLHVRKMGIKPSELIRFWIQTKVTHYQAR